MPSAHEENTDWPGRSNSFAKFYSETNGDEPEDIEGLIAYALYRRSKQEWAEEKKRSPEEAHSYFEKSATAVHIQAFRTQSREMLAVFGESIINQKRPSILDEIQKDQFEATQRLIEELDRSLVNQTESTQKLLESQIKETNSLMKKRTGAGPSILANLIAWFITILVISGLSAYYLLPELIEQLTLLLLQIETPPTN